MKNVVSKNGVWKTAPLNDTPSGGPLVVTDTDGTLNKTWQEIHDAMMNGIVYVLSEQSYSSMVIVTGTLENDDSNEYTVFAGYEGNAYVTNTKTGYPQAL